MKLYNENDFIILINKTKQSFVCFIVFVSLFVASIAAFILLSFYEMRLLFQILGSVISVLFAAFSIYFLDRNLFFRRLASEYLNILNDNGKESRVKILEINDKIITLSDKSKVYEITCLEAKKTRVIYLSSLFDLSLKKDKEYRIITAFNYVKEYYEQN